MVKTLAAALVVALALALSPLAQPSVAAAADHATVAKHKRVAQKSAHKRVTHAHRKRRVARHWRGYGFLPGYVPPEITAREREWHYWQSQPQFLRPVWPRFYRGRWNGGGFGPCYVYTPIGYMWTCGK